MLLEVLGWRRSNVATERLRLAPRDAQLAAAVRRLRPSPVSLSLQYLVAEAGSTQTFSDFSPISSAAATRGCRTVSATWFASALCPSKKALGRDENDESLMQSSLNGDCWN